MLRAATALKERKIGSKSLRVVSGGNELPELVSLLDVDRLF